MEMKNRKCNENYSKHHENGEVVDKVKLKPGELPRKMFAPRNSVLTDLWEIKHICTIYNIFLAMLFGLFVNTAVYDYLNKGEIKLGFNLIIKGFSKFHFLLLIWICMFLANFLVYYGFALWALIRIRTTPQSKQRKIWDKTCLGLIIVYWIGFLCLFTSMITELELPPAASATLLCEITRYLMKTYAFVRSNAPIALRKTLSAAEKHHKRCYPELEKFIYFHFAPTLIYQDSYPRTSSIRWGYVAYCFLEVIGGIFYSSFLLERFLVEPFEDFGIKPYRWQYIIMTILNNTAAGMLMMLASYYVTVHAWMNGFAEMLRFADRMFYKDWWTSSSYERYHRTWNVLVHDWFYTYIYRDCIEILLPNKKVTAKYSVFFISAVFHEYILAFTFRFFFPILFIQFFGVNTAFMYLKFNQVSLGNAFVWYFTSLGMSINTCVYAIEYYSRLNCPIENVTVYSYFIPRMFSCNK